MANCVLVNNTGSGTVATTGGSTSAPTSAITGLITFNTSAGSSSFSKTTASALGAALLSTLNTNQSHDLFSPTRDSTLDNVRLLKTGDHSSVLPTILPQPSTSNCAFVATKKPPKSISKVQSEIEPLCSVDQQNSDSTDLIASSSKYQLTNKCLCSLDRLQLRRDLQKWSKNTLLFVGKFVWNYFST